MLFSYKHTRTRVRSMPVADTLRAHLGWAVANAFHARLGEAVADAPSGSYAKLPQTSF